MAKINGLGKIERKSSGMGEDIGLSIMQLGMITGLHAAISPSFFTFACFAKKPAERDCAVKTLWISLGATTLVNLGTLLAFGRWLPAIMGQLTGVGLFAGGLIAASSESAPEKPTMDNTPPEESAMRGIGQMRRQPGIMVAQDHWLDRQWPDRYADWWDAPAPRL